MMKKGMKPQKSIQLPTVTTSVSPNITQHNKSVGPAQQKLNAMLNKNKTNPSNLNQLSVPTPVPNIASKPNQNDDID